MSHPHPIDRRSGLQNQIDVEQAEQGFRLMTRVAGSRRRPIRGITRRQMEIPPQEGHVAMPHRNFHDVRPCLQSRRMGRWMKGFRCVIMFSTSPAVRVLNDWRGDTPQKHCRREQQRQTSSQNTKSHGLISPDKPTLQMAFSHSRAAIPKIPRSRKSHKTITLCETLTSLLIGFFSIEF